MSQRGKLTLNLQWDDTLCLVALIISERVDNEIGAFCKGVIRRMGAGHAYIVVTRGRCGEGRTAVFAVKGFVNLCDAARGAAAHSRSRIRRTCEPTKTQ